MTPNHRRSVPLYFSFFDWINPTLLHRILFHIFILLVAAKISLIILYQGHRIQFYYFIIHLDFQDL